MPCVKVCFSKAEATGALKSKMRGAKQWRREKRIYYCEEHNAWHLTSMDSGTKVVNIKLTFADRFLKFLA